MMEENTLKIIEDLNLSESQTTLLIEAIEWEKELSWSDGYASAADQEAQSYEAFGDKKI